MTEERNVKVKLTAEVEGYLAAMQAATEATQALLDLGVEKKDLGGALKSALDLANAGRRTISERIDIVWSTESGKSSIVIDGVDITYWIANEPVVVESANGTTTVTVKLTAPTVMQTILP